MQIGILGGTGPAGRGLAVRLAAAGDEVVIGSRDAERADTIAHALVEEWPNYHLAITGASNEDTVKPLASALAGKVVVSMAIALHKEGREFISLVPPRGSVAASIQAALPDSLVSASFHHLPASEMEKLNAVLAADVMVCSDHAEATAVTMAMVDRIGGLRAINAGSLAQAAPMEALTATLITINIRNKVHASVQLTGFGDR
jgi:NADPH-dependent F420 reductase